MRSSMRDEMTSLLRFHGANRDQLDRLGFDEMFTLYCDLLDEITDDNGNVTGPDPGLIVGWSNGKLDFAGTPPPMPYIYADGTIRMEGNL